MLMRGPTHNLVAIALVLLIGAQILDYLQRPANQSVLREPNNITTRAISLAVNDHYSSYRVGT